MLSVLAAGRRCAEAGTAFGLGAEAMARTAASVVTVELDPQRAEKAHAYLDNCANVELLVGDWQKLLPARGPFDLVFLDAGGVKQDPAAHLQPAVALLASFGLLVLDDFTPGYKTGDRARVAIDRHPELTSAEILTTPETSAIVATRVRAAA